MDFFSKFTIAHFIWYLVPGITLFIYILFPLLIYFPIEAQTLLNSFGTVGVILICIVFGFILEGIRPYRFRVNYKSIRKEYFDKLKCIISTELNPYFIHNALSETSKEKKITGLSLHHSIWIMLGHIASLSFGMAAFWLIMFLYYCVKTDSYFCSFYDQLLPREHLILISLAFTAVFIFIAFRLAFVATEEQKYTNQMFLDFASLYKYEIKCKLKIS